MSTIQERVIVESADAGARLDRWLTDQLTELDYAVSRSQVQSWVDAGMVMRAGRHVKSSEPVVEGAMYDVAVTEPESQEVTPEQMDLDIAYEDADVLVVNKPRGLVVHPGAGHWQGTLVNGLLGRGTHLSSLGGSTRPGIVHRIDKDTSGLLVVAKSDRAYHSLTEQLRVHEMERMYLAIAHGRVPHQVGLVDAPIGRDPNQRQRMAVAERGKHAVTHFRVVEWFEHYSYLSLRLETGRTHQIRVHLAYIGHPLAGDPVYGPRHTLDISGQALHASKLGFTHPVSGERLVFEAPLPLDMERLLELLRNKVVE